MWLYTVISQKPLILGIETSCDETAVAILDVHAFHSSAPVNQFLLADLISSQVKLHEPYGGVVPELASRAHMANLPLLIDEALRVASCSLADVGAISVTRGPGLNGCLLVGLSFAKSLGLSLRIPVLPVHHILAHVFSFLLCEGRPEQPYPALCLVVSGGHTLLVLVKGPEMVEVIASTRDDAAGEAFDKIASLLGLPYPGGPALSARAERGDPKRFSLPRIMAKDPVSFSFSGLKTACARLAAKVDLTDDQVVSDIAAAAQAAIVRSLVDKTAAAMTVHRPRAVLATGGVAANRSLREALTDAAGSAGVPAILVPPRWCTDNAAMIAVLGALSLKGLSIPSWNPFFAKQSAPGVELDVGPRPRWPLEEGVLRLQNA